jgi:hypothetical protein
MKNEIYTVYKCTAINKKERYFIDLWGVIGKIEISVNQFWTILGNAKERNFCRHTEIAYPNDLPDGVSAVKADLYVIS